MAPFIRIALRYLAAALVTYGLVSPEAAHVLAHDHDIALAVEVLAGLVLAALTEGVYLVARKMGWRT